MNTNFEHYRIFYYVAKYGNLTKAATVLHTSQPSVTRTIHNLEKNLNCRLFERSKVGMKLTPEGEVFYEYIAAGCAQFFKAESNLSDMLSLENGTIYVSATETALHCYLFQAMESFNEQYPNVHFKILNNSTRKSINIVKEGNVDFAVVSAPFQIEKPLQQKVLRKYHDILIGGKRFEELKGQKISIKQLAQYPWISLTPEAITRKFLNQYFEKNGLKFEADMELATTDMIVNRDHLTTIMITHNMKDAIAHGNRLIMLMDGKIILDIKGEEKKKLTVEDLLHQFEKASGEEFANDRALLS